MPETWQLLPFWKIDRLEQPAPQPVKEGRKKRCPAHHCGCSLHVQAPALCRILLEMRIRHYDSGRLGQVESAVVVCEAVTT
jgi:hypothetical protein